MSWISRVGILYPTEIAVHKLALVSLSLFVGAGCLAPVDAPIADAGGAPINRAPAIAPEQTTPSEGIVQLNANCSEQEFRIGAVDEMDLNDVLYVRWFVDYDGEDNVGIAQDSLLPREQVTTRRVGTSFRLQFNSPRHFPNGLRIGAAEAHQLEAVVSDRDFVSGQNPLNRAVPEEARFDHVWWLLVFSDDEDCPEVIIP